MYVGLKTNVTYAVFDATNFVIGVLIKCPTNEMSRYVRLGS